MIRRLRTLGRLVRNLALLPEIRHELGDATRQLKGLSARLDREGSQAPPALPEVSNLDHSGREARLTLPSGQAGLFVPLDHDAALRPRPANYLYAEVLRRIEKDAGPITRFIEGLRPCMADGSLDSIPAEKADERTPYWHNGYFNGDDARLLSAFIGHVRPRRILEIGSGNSTKFARRAIKTYGTETRITSIDPFPRADIAQVSDRIIRESILDVDLGILEELEPGDLLFHDGSHITFNGTDTVCLFLEILPRIRPGVFVHIHDISLPREYIAAFDQRGYSEQYMLAACLLFSEAWEILAPVAYLHEQGALAQGGTSFWMRRAAVS